jgi:hypothetical protein
MAFGWIGSTTAFGNPVAAASKRNRPRQLYCGTSVRTWALVHMDKVDAILGSVILTILALVIIDGLVWSIL